MLDLTARDAVLRRRLEAYADARLSPDLATSGRLRARVLAVAHRQAALHRADAGLTVVSPTAQRGDGTASDTGAQPNPNRRTSVRGAAAAVAVATLVLAVGAGAVFAAQAGGPLYGARVWAEGLVLPHEAGARAVAELDRLERRLDEAVSASARGDAAAAAAALAAYETILQEASEDAATDDDDVALAALEAGVAHNIIVLQALVERLPDHAAAAIGAAIDRAIERSDGAIDRIGNGDGTGGNGNGNGVGGGGGGDGGDGKGSGSDGAGGAKPTPHPVATHDPSATSKPDKTPSGGGKPDKSPAPGGGNGGGNGAAGGGGGNGGNGGNGSDRGNGGTDTGD